MKTKVEAVGKQITWASYRWHLFCCNKKQVLSSHTKKKQVSDFFLIFKKTNSILDTEKLRAGQQSNAPCFGF